jgi:hypothetical protein
MKKFLLLLSLFLIFSTAYSQKIGNNPGINANVLQSNSSVIKIEYNFGGFYGEDIKINGKVYANISSPGMSSIMEKGNPQLPTYCNSVVIPDNASMNYRITGQEYYEISTKTIMPSKGHYTRDKDPNSIPYTFNEVYNQDTWFPTNNIDLKEPFVVRDLRGMTIQFNPVQYNPKKGTLRIYTKYVIELYQDFSKAVVNPLIRMSPFTGVSSDFTGVYRTLFMNYGVDGSRFDSIAEPGKMLIICPTAYLSSITQFVQWKQSRGLNVTIAEYPTVTGSGNTAIKTYIQNMYNSPGSVTYIVLVGDVADIPTLSGVYESAPSDPCYVKLAGTDAYPDAFISRISCQSTSNVYYVTQKLIKFERDIQVNDPWFTKGVGIGGADVGGTPAYADSIRMNWIRDTLMSHGFTQVDKINGPVATPQDLINALNNGRYILNYIGHGSGTSWSNTGFSTTNSYQLANGWKNPFLVDVACLNGNLTLSECLAESLLRAGDTANPKGCISIYASSTNASWVPPCDMQAYAMGLFARQGKTTAGAISFFGVMKAMDINGGSTGEGLKLMEQYNLFGDCSLLLTRGVPLGPSITHNPLPNTENLAGPYVVNCVVTPANAPLKPGMTKLYWTRASAYDSVTMTNTSGNNWTANIPGNGLPATYKYYLKTIDTMNRAGVLPGGAPANYFSFIASADTVKPVIVHTQISPTPKSYWPVSVSASVTDNIGLDSVWVEWYKNTPSPIKEFKLNLSSGNNFSAIFNSVNSDVVVGDHIYYVIKAKDNSTNHNTTQLPATGYYNFPIITLRLCEGYTNTAFPPSGWAITGTSSSYWTRNDVSSYGLGTGSARFNFYSVSSGNAALTTLTFDPTISTDSLKIDKAHAYYGTTYIDSLRIEASTNSGSTYSLITVLYSTTNFSAPYALSTVSSTSLFVPTSSQWNTRTFGLPVGTNKIRFNAVSGYGNDLFLDSIRIISIFTGIHNIGLEIPNVYQLYQNYPNPFNPITKINFDIPKQGLVTIKVFDILGREVKTLINEVKAPGKYSIDFNGMELSSGVYFYKLESNGFMDIKRMVLIK